MEVTKIWESDKKDDYIFFNDIHEFVEYIYGNDISLNIYFENSDSDFISLITGLEINSAIFYVYKKLSNKENWKVRKNIKMTKLINNIMNNDIFPYEIDGYH